MNQKVIWLVLIFGLILITPAMADVHQFTGEWNNIDNNLNGLSKLEIGFAGNVISVQVWGKSGSDIQSWGKVTGYAYAAYGSPNLNSSAKVISAVFQIKGRQSVLIIRPQGTYRLQVEEFTRSLSENGQTNYQLFHTFAKNQ